MTGLKISICFWYLDPLVVDDVMQALKNGHLDAATMHCKDRDSLRSMLTGDLPHVIIADFDAPKKFRDILEREMGPYFTEVPLIYLVGSGNERKAAEALKTGVWDYVIKESLYKLVPSVHSSQKYSKVIRQARAAERAL